MAELARRYVEAGCRFLKTHIGADAEEGLGRLEAIREAT